MPTRRTDSSGSHGLHTLELGESGPRVAFCHGLFGQGKNWTQIGKSLADRHRVLLIDLPDHGRSAWTDRWDYVEAADRVAALLGEGDPVALVGHSMGGKTAMVLALRHPGLVERLCVVDVSPVAYRHTAEFERYLDAMIGLDLVGLRRRSEAADALADAVADPTVRAFLLQNLHHDSSGWSWRPNLRGLRESLPDITGWPGDRLDGLEPYRGKVLWVGGGDSRYVQPEYAAAMEGWFPGVRRVTVKNAGHWVHSEQPEVFEEVLTRFLDAE